MERCRWVNLKNPHYIKYHDEEWSIPSHDDQYLFEMLVLESFQAGLSWETILIKRENFKEAFDGLDPAVVAGYDEDKVQLLMNDKGIVRNKLKINAAIQNAAAFLKIQEEFGSFDKYIWSFTDGKSVVEPYYFCTSSLLSDTVSKDLKNRGMTFVGTTIIYSYLQAIGVIDAHGTECDCYKKIE